jgi:hypothetical protein
MRWDISYCNYPDCPNYGLLQADMDKQIKKEMKRDIKKGILMKMEKKPSLKKAKVKSAFDDKWSTKYPKGKKALLKAIDKASKQALFDVCDHCGKAGNDCLCS